jgi:hypothetical protein
VLRPGLDALRNELRSGRAGSVGTEGMNPFWPFALLPYAFKTEEYKPDTAEKKGSNEAQK